MNFELLILPANFIKNLHLAMPGLASDQHHILHPRLLIWIFKYGILHTGNPSR